MKIREFMNNNSALVTILAVVVLVVSLGVIIMNTRGPGVARTIDLYFYDLNTGKLFTAKSDQIPPIEAPSGPLQGQPGNLPAGVRAHVYACGECPDLTGMTLQEVEQAGAYIAYVEMYTEQGKAALTAGASGPPEGPMIDPMEQTLIARVPELAWQPMYSDAGFRLTESGHRACPDGSAPQPCRP